VDRDGEPSTREALHDCSTEANGPAGYERPSNAVDHGCLPKFQASAVLKQRRLWDRA